MMDAEERRRLFLSDLRARLPALRQLVQALCASDPAAAEGVAEQLRRQAHDIKGTGAAFACPEATDIARQLEADLQPGRPARLSQMLCRVAALDALCHEPTQPPQRRAAAADPPDRDGGAQE